MHLYPNLSAVLKAEFDSLNNFARKAGIPEATVKHFILGNLGPMAEINARERVEAALRTLRPALKQDGLWARQEPTSVKTEVKNLGGRRWQIITTMTQTFKDLGPAREE